MQQTISTSQKDSKESAVQGQPQRRLLSYRDAALYLGISARTLATLVAQREVPSVKYVGRVLFDIRDLDNSIDAHRVAAK